MDLDEQHRGAGRVPGDDGSKADVKSETVAAPVDPYGLRSVQIGGRPAYAKVFAIVDRSSQPWAAGQPLPKDGDKMEFVIRQLPFTIGRTMSTGASAENFFVLNNSRVSRVHATIGAFQCAACARLAAVPEREDSLCPLPSPLLRPIAPQTTTTAATAGSSRTCRATTSG